MADFIRDGLSSNIDFTAAVWSDIHGRTSLTNYARCITNLALFKTHLLQQQFDLHLIPGDIIDEHTSMPAIEDIISSSGKPAYRCRGNHDYVFSHELLGIPSPGYYPQDLGTNWRLITLDVTEKEAGGNQYNPGTYKLLSTQQSWFASQLEDAAADGKYVIIMLHVPIAGFAPWKYEARQEADDPIVQSAMGVAADMMQDQNTICEALNLLPNVKAVIYGHWHLKDRTYDRGIWHFCPGAISGNFWASPLTKFGEDPSYGKMICFKDGTISWTDLYYPYQN